MDFRRLGLLPALVLVLGALPGPAGDGDEPAVRGNRGASLKGSARLARNRPVVGATVRIHRENDRSRYLLTSTDGRGYLETLELSDGDYRVTLTKDGLAPVEKSGIRVKFPFRPVVEVGMEPGPPAAPVPAAVTAGQASLAGQVLDREGKPVADVLVRLVREDGAGDPVRLRSGEDGGLGEVRLPSGSWKAEVRGVGYLAIRSVLVLEGPTRLDALLVSQPAGYLAPAIDLLPEEQPVPPAGLTPRP